MPGEHRTGTRVTLARETRFSTSLRYLPFLTRCFDGSTSTRGSWATNVLGALKVVVDGGRREVWTLVEGADDVTLHLAVRTAGCWEGALAPSKECHRKESLASRIVERTHQARCRYRYFQTSTELMANV